MEPFRWRRALFGLNPTSALPGAISLAEPVRMKENMQFSFTFGRLSPLQSFIHSFWVLTV